MHVKGVSDKGDQDGIESVGYTVEDEEGDHSHKESRPGKEGLSMHSWIE